MKKPMPQQTTTRKLPVLPTLVAAEMDTWRAKAAAGLDEGVPRNYITFHGFLADEDLKLRISENHGDERWVIVENEGHMYCGMSFDGMTQRTLTIAVKEMGKWTCHRIKWHESGAWFKQGAGWSRFAEMRPLTNQLALERFAAFEAENLMGLSGQAKAIPKAILGVA